MSSESKKILIAGSLIALTVAWGVQRYLPQGNRGALIGTVQSVPTLPDGTLIRSAQDDRVYYMEGNLRRWIVSADALYAQGFHVENIQTMLEEQIDQYQQGDPIDVHTLVTLPTERAQLPDLAPLAPYQLHLAKVNGRAVIKFTGSFWNGGGQSFWLLPGKSITPEAQAEGQAPVYERIVATDGSVRLKLIDNFIYHPAHHHLHLADFGYYVFAPIRTLAGDPIPGAPSVQDKTTFCMRDDELMTANLPGVPSRPVFTECGVQGQGVSVGWIDVYPYTLVDQLVDVQNMPAGIYSLSFMLDPEQHYLENRKDNNIATTILRLDVQRGIVRVIAAAAPFVTDRNILPDGMLIKAGGDNKIYVISGGKKRWLHAADIFSSYGYAWQNVYVLAQGIVDAIPNVQLIELAGTKDIYVLDDQGHKRHVLTPEELHAGGFQEKDVVDVNQVEFDGYSTLTN